MEDQNTPRIGESTVLTIPAFSGSSALSLDISKTREAESRFHEIQTVSLITYVELEHTFQESYRELKRHYATINHELAKAEKELRLAKATVLLEKYPEYMATKPRVQDNADTRDSFMVRDEQYAASLDRINMLKAIHSFVDGRIKGLENACKYMRKQVDIVMRSGMVGGNIHNSIGKK